MKNYHSSDYLAGTPLSPSLSLELNILDSHLSQMVIFLDLHKKIQFPEPVTIYISMSNSGSQEEDKFVSCD